MPNLKEELKGQLAALQKAVKSPTHNPDKVKDGIKEAVNKGENLPRKSDIGATGEESTLSEIHKAEGYSRASIESNDSKISKRAEYQNASDQLWLFDKIMKQVSFDNGEDWNIKAASRSNPRVRKMFQRLYDSANDLGCGGEIKKALGSTVAGGGDEWVPTNTTSQLFTELRLETRLADVFQKLPMTSDPMDIPRKTAGLTVYRTGESLNDISAKHRSSQMTTGKMTLTTRKMAARTLWSEELNEDSIIAALPVIQDDIRMAMSEALESAMINGDTAATHLDNGTVSNYYGSDAPETAFLGMRAWADDESNETAATGTIAISDFRNVRKSMGKYGLNPQDLVWVTSPDGYYAMSQFEQVETVEKYGPQATILTGELARFYGIPIIVSGQMPENLSATGVYDGVTTDNTVVQLVRRDFALWGTKRELTIKMRDDIETDQKVLVGTFRPAFTPRWPSGENPIWTLLDVD